MHRQAVFGAGAHTHSLTSSLLTEVQNYRLQRCLLFLRRICNSCCSGRDETKLGSFTVLGCGCSRHADLPESARACFLFHRRQPHGATRCPGLDQPWMDGYVPIT